jgi:Flp pilus assembly protein TadG
VTTRTRGQILPFMAILLMALFAVVGLAADGGQVLVARREAQGIADAAARTGAEQLDEASVRSGDARPTLDQAQAYTAAATYVAVQRPGFAAAIGTGPDHVDVRVTTTVPLSFMQLVGLRSARIEADGSASPRTGITQVGN